MVTDPLFVLHMSPQQLPRHFFIILSSTCFEIIISNNSQWLDPCVCWCVDVCVSPLSLLGFEAATVGNIGVYSTKVTILLAWEATGSSSPVLSAHSWHSICHSFIQRKTSTFKAPHPLTESSPSESNEHVEIQWILICCYIRTRDKGSRYIMKGIGREKVAISSTFSKRRWRKGKNN